MPPKYVQYFTLKMSFRRETRRRATGTPEIAQHHLIVEKKVKNNTWAGVE